MKTWLVSFDSRSTPYMYSIYIHMLCLPRKWSVVMKSTCRCMTWWFCSVDTACVMTPCGAQCCWLHNQAHNQTVVRTPVSLYSTYRPRTVAPPLLIHTAVLYYLYVEVLPHFTLLHMMILLKHTKCLASTELLCTCTYKDLFFCDSSYCGQLCDWSRWSIHVACLITCTCMLITKCGTAQHINALHEYTKAGNWLQGLETQLLLSEYNPLCVYRNTITWQFRSGCCLWYPLSTWVGTANCAIQGCTPCTIDF